MLCLIYFILFLYCFFFVLVKWGPCVYLIDAVPLLGVSNRSCWFINKKILVWHLKMPAEPFSRQSELLYAECSQSGPLCSSSWMFSVLCTVSPSLLAKAWSKGVFPLERRFQNQRMSIRTGRMIRAKITHCVCLLHLHKHPCPAGWAGRGVFPTPHWPGPKDCSRGSGRRRRYIRERDGRKERTETKGGGQLPHPVSLLNVCSVADKQPHHVRPVSQDCDV